jgi:hypothetical protein
MEKAPPFPLLHIKGKIEKTGIYSEARKSLFFTFSPS